MSKIYCYVDESGQHTQGDFFSVAVVIVNTTELRDEGERMLLEVERTQAGVVYKKVRGAKDEGNAWIRLADAIAGFSWDVYENKPYTQSLYPDMQKQGFFIQL